MKERNEIDKIRELLGRWYSGQASPQEEGDLMEMLLSASNLPDDLSEERSFFSVLASTKFDFPAMPLEYSKRINAALETEMKSAHLSNVSHRPRFSRRLWIRSLSGVAACIAIAFCGLQLWKAPDIQPMQPEVKVAMSIAHPVESYDSLPMISLTLNGNQANKEVNSGRSYGNLRKVHPGKKYIRNHSGEREDKKNEDREHLYEEEEARLARNNYRVVTDASEADDILNSIFSRMENAMAMESSRISKIELEYASEMTRLTQLDNIDTNTEQYHDASPL